MKRINYKIMSEINFGTEDEPDIRQNIRGKSLPYTEANYQLALSEAYNGEVTIEDDGQSEPKPSESEQLRHDVDELQEALNMILMGVTE